MAKILIINDKAEESQGIKESIQDLNVELFMADSLDKAVALAEQHQFTLLLLLKGLGREQETELERGALKIPTMVFSDTLAEQYQSCIAFPKTAETSHIIDYLPKTINESLLINKVKAFLETARTQETLKKELESRKKTELLAKKHAEHFKSKATDLKLNTHVASNKLKIVLDKLLEASQYLIKHSGKNTASPTLKEKIKTIEIAHEEIQDLVEAYQKQDALQENLQFTEVSMAKILEEVLANVEIDLKKTKAKLDYQPAVFASCPPVLAEPQQLVAVIQQLIDNALKHRGDAKAAPMIQLDLEIQPEFCLISVADNGPGIDPRYADILFWGIKPELAAIASKQGIGLAIARKIIEQHGGKIWAHLRATSSKAGSGIERGTETGRSTVIETGAGTGTGTTFYVALPLAHTSAASTVTSSAASSSASLSPSLSVLSVVKREV